ncbi:MAG TPA: PAS domain S-box protein [Methylococcales bacterium]|nr:PAS domain S-box protein [Methylococcales bacterium]
MSLTQNELTAQIQRLTTTLNNVGAYIYTKDMQGHYTYANQMVCDLFNCSLNGIVGLSDKTFFDLSTFNELQNNDRRVLDDGEHIESEETNIIIQTGEKRIYWTVKKPLTDSHGQIIGLCGISTDITERRILEEKLMTASQTQDKLLSIMGHDLKGPIGFIAGLFNSGILKDNNKSPDLWSAIHTSINNIHEILENLLYWAQCQKGDLQPDKVQIKIEPHLKSSKKAYEAAIKNKNITLNFEIEAELYIDVDPFMFDTIIRNILHNAIKFTPQNGAITLTAEQTDNSISISITDSGLGMKPSTLETLFTPKKHNPLSGTNGTQNGTGLGLMLCKEFVELHNGTIGVDSVVHKGSRFWFTLPKT